MEILRNSRTLILFEGIIFAILGILAIAAPLISTLATELFIGWLLIIGGVFQGYRAFKLHGSRGFYLSLVIALLNVILGILLITHPIVGMLSLTFLLTLFFIFQGVAQIVFAFRLKPISGWIWMLINGVLSILLAVLIWSGWPESAFWVIGTLLGVYMLFFGIALITLSFGLSKFDSNHPS